jgi:prolyl-tRNA synthetase
VRAHADLREAYSPGWKFSDWEVKGIPLRLEIGPRDLADSTITTARRDTGIKGQIPLATCQRDISILFQTIHRDLFEKADKNYRSQLKIVTVWDNFVSTLNDKNFCLSSHCLGGPCEDEIKKLSARRPGVDSMVENAQAPSMGAKSLCIPFEQPAGLVKGETKCVNPNCWELAQDWVMFGRSY